MVYVHEVIEQARRFAAGFHLDEESAGLEEIQQVGPGGNFLTTRSTLQRFRTAYYDSPIFPRWSAEQWKAKRGPPAIDILRQYTQDLMAGLKPPEDYGALMAHGESFIERSGGAL